MSKNRPLSYKPHLWKVSNFLWRAEVALAAGPYSGLNIGIAHGATPVAAYSALIEGDPRMRSQK